MKKNKHKMSYFGELDQDEKAPKPEKTTPKTDDRISIELVRNRINNEIDTAYDDDRSEGFRLGKLVTKLELYVEELDKLLDATADMPSADGE